MHTQRKSRVRLGTAAAAVLLGTVVSACREPPQQQPVQSKAVERAVVPVPPPVERAVAPAPQAVEQAVVPAPQAVEQAVERAVTPAPQPVIRCINPEPDSAAAAAAAVEAVSAGGPLPLRVSSFTRHYEGALVSVLPVSTATTGGGGLVWVDRDGCITVIKRYE